MQEQKRRVPPWLVGLILAVVASVIVLLVLDALGYGDDPSVGAIGLLTWQWSRPTGASSEVHMLCGGSMPPDPG